MAIRLLDSTVKTPLPNPAPKQQMAQEMPKTSLLPGLARSVVAGTLGAPGELLQGIGAISKKLGGKSYEELQEESLFSFPTYDQIMKAQQKIFGSEFKPTHFFEKAAELTAKNLGPLALINKGLSASKIGLDLLSSAGQVAGEKIGGPLGGIIGALAVPSAGKSVAGKLRKTPSIEPAKLMQLGEQAAKKLYDTERKLGSQIKINPEPLQKKMENLLAKVDSSSFKDSAQKAHLKETLQTYKNSLITGEPIHASRLVEMEQNINRNRPTFLGTENKSAKHIMDSAKKAVEEEIKAIGSQHKNNDWFKAYEGGKEVTRALHWQDNINEMIETIPVLGKALTNDMVKVLLGGGAGFKALGVPGLVGAAGGLAAAKKAGNAIAFLNESPTTQKIFMEAIENIGKRNYKPAASALIKLNKRADTYDKRQGIKDIPVQTGKQVPGTTLRIIS